LGVIFVVNLAYVWNHVGVPFKCTIIKRCNMWLQNICGEMVSRSENYKIMFPFFTVCDCDLVNILDVMLIFSPSLGFESQ
jgi:hypothetical protein